MESKLKPGKYHKKDILCIAREAYVNMQKNGMFFELNTFTLKDVSFLLEVFLQYGWEHCEDEQTFIEAFNRLLRAYLSTLHNGTLKPIEARVFTELGIPIVKPLVHQVGLTPEKFQLAVSLDIFSFRDLKLALIVIYNHLYFPE